MPEKTALIILAEGAEESETVITADMLRRAGINVTVAGLLGMDPVKCCRGITIVPDTSLSGVMGNSFNIIVLPGGQTGSENLSRSEAVGEMLRKQNEAGRLIAAICGGPVALATHKIPADTVTSHPSTKKVFDDAGYKYSADRVVVAGNVITSQAPGTAFEFTLKIIEMLLGEESACKLIEPMVICCPKCPKL